MYNTEIGKFCAEHDNWEELLQAEPYCLKIKIDGDYVIFNYDQISSDFNTKIVQEARGIIFRTGEWENPVCWAFNKFGNYGESYVPDIDWSTAFVTEKVDGSLMKVWYDSKGDWCGWHISTNGAIDAFKAPLSDIKVKNFGDYFLMALNSYTPPYRFRDCFTEFLHDLDEDYTYMFELVGPYNRVVIPYAEPALYFLGARNKYTGEERFCIGSEMKSLGVSDMFNRPAQYPLTSLEDCINATEKFDWDQEGFVVADANFNRVKVKSPAYVLAHFMRNNNVVTRKHIIKIILMNEVEEFICYASEYKDELTKIQWLMNAYHNIGNRLAEACRQLVGKLDRGDYARMVKTLPAIFHGLLFYNYDRIITAEEYTKDWNENKWDTYIEAIEKLGQEVLTENGELCKGFY